MMTPTAPPLQTDLVALLRATRAAERDLFAALEPELREAPDTIGTWSAKDVLAHLAAWRSVEARRLEAAAAGSAPPADDPAPSDPEDASNATIHAERAGWTWEQVATEAEASVESLIAAIGRSTHDALCACDGTTAGTGSNAANHAVAHLSDVARLAGDEARFSRFAADIEAILGGNHLPPRDSGVILYNLACHHALGGQLDDARRLLRSAFARRPDLLETAGSDPDLAALADELDELA